MAASEAKPHKAVNFQRQLCADIVQKPAHYKASAGGGILFLGKAFSGIWTRGRSPGGTIFYPSDLTGLHSDFFHNIRL
jgi:hypothetical protein